MRTVWIIARHTFKECTRRKIFLIVPLITIGFVVLYGIGNHFAFRSTEGTIEAEPGLVDATALVGSTLVGLSMFVTLFLTSSLGIFLTFGAVRGDAEIGLLQQLVARPVARTRLLAGRFLGASVLCAGYALFLYLACVLVTGSIGGWWPTPFLTPGLAVMGGVVVVIALSLLGSVFLSALPNGIVMFMVYGAGLLGGLLAQLGEVITSSALRTTGRITSWLLPFEALYQAGLNSLTAGATGLTRVIVQLGPLGGAQEGGPWLPLWTLAYLGAVWAATLFAFARKDL
ncbi:MAG TPA: ABC transporter permease subunit [Actinomycetota bacterium]|nr:ABC transporter permease subunit [Actinomycetota bacterium]